MDAGRSGRGASRPISRRRFSGASLAFATGLSAALLAGSGTGRQTGGRSVPPRDEPGDSTKGGKTLAVCYSAQEHTRRVAQAVAEAIGADTFEITPARPYTAEDLDRTNGSRRKGVNRQRKSLRPNMGTEARLPNLLTAVVGDFAMALVRKETQRHSAALKSAGQSPIGLLPFDGRFCLSGCRSLHVIRPRAFPSLPFRSRWYPFGTHGTWSLIGMRCYRQDKVRHVRCRINR